MATIEISPEAAGAAQTAVESLATELESAGKFPSLSYTNAPIAVGGRDEVQTAWDRRMRSEVDGAEGLALAFSLIAEIFAEGDSRLREALVEVDYLISVDGGGT